MDEEIKKAQMGVRLLKKDRRTSYSQKRTAVELTLEGFTVSESSVSNLIHYKERLKRGEPPMGGNILNVLIDGISELIKKRLGMVYNEINGTYEHDANLEIVDPSRFKSKSEISANGIIIFSKGRRNVEHKVQLMDKVKSGDTITEMGLRLHSFSNYFTSERDELYLEPVRDLLARGVNLHCYFLKHNGRFALRYFETRDLIPPSLSFKGLEMKAYNQMPEIVEKLKSIRNNLNAEEGEGKMELFEYDCAPEYHAFVAGDAMLIAHYMFGIDRKNSPIFEINRNENRSLFNKYLQSIDAIKSISKRIE